MKKLRIWLRKIIKTRAFHLCIIATIILILIAFAYTTIEKYEQEGEKEMPFEVSKINVISSVYGEEIEGLTPEEQATNRWNLNVGQNNDFYLYIEKNNSYKGRTQEAIESVLIENFETNKKAEKGTIKIYKPEENSDKDLLKNSKENEVEKLEYIGSPESKVKSMQMSNQGDLIYFRIANKNITKYSSNDEEINYNQLLNKAGIKEEELKIQIKFDMQIRLVSGKIFRTTVDTEVPVSGVVEQGTTSGEIIDVNKLIFKRD